MIGLSKKKKKRQTPQKHKNKYMYIASCRVELRINFHLYVQSFYLCFPKEGTCREIYFPRRQLQSLSSKIGVALQPVFSTMKVCNIVKTREPKPKTINEQCVVYHFKCAVCDMDYVGFTNRHIQLFQLTLSDESMKLKDKTESLRGIFMNKFIKISHAWRKQ